MDACCGGGGWIDRCVWRRIVHSGDGVCKGGTMAEVQLEPVKKLSASFVVKISPTICNLLGDFETRTNEADKFLYS